MGSPRLMRWAPLGLLGWCCLAACSSAQYRATSQVATEAPGPLGPPLCSDTELTNPDCPHRRKAATLLPSFTKTTVTPTHHHMTNHTTVPANHTTPHPANHTTVPANHTTPHPANHTTAPHHHTTAHATNHSTAPPVHTTTHLHTAAPAPTQIPFVPVGNYVVQSGSAPPCLRVQAGLELQVRFTDRAKQKHLGTFAVQPNHTRMSGNCSNQTATLHLRFPEGYLAFTFQKNKTGNIFYLSRTQANLTYQFQQATETTFAADNSSLQEFKASLGHSYQCRNRTLVLAEGFQLRALQERVQAFELQGGEFGEAEVCPEQRRTPYLPIIIGVLLVILIIIVVAAFAVGRWRTHRGYQTI